MKRTLLSLFLVCGLTAFADHPDHLKADGHAVYKVGKTVEKKDAVLYVPKAGKGKLILEVDGKEVESDKTFMVKAGGRDIFYVQFTNVPGTAKDSVMLLRGTLIHGENAGVYYGDFFMKKAAAPAPKPTTPTTPTPAPKDPAAPAPKATTASIDMDEETAACLVEGTCGDDFVATDDSDVDSDDDEEEDGKEWATACTGKNCPAHKGGKHHGGHHHRGHGHHHKGGHHHGRGHHHRGAGWTFGGGFGFHAKIVVTK